MGTRELVGRADELAAVDSFVRLCAHDGGALLVTGEPGVGKTALLDAAAGGAAAAGVRVLRAAGVEFEAELSFSGLNQLLLPLARELAGLPSAVRDPLSVALGLGEGAVAGHLVVANATITLLRHCSARQPLLLVVDDVPWLDRTSAAVLTLVSRRLSGSRTGLLAAARPDAGGFFERAGLPGLQLRPLGDDAAERLLTSSFPALASRVSARVLREAQGNPLALLELPTALAGATLAVAAGELPLTARLRALFHERIDALPGTTRRALLAAALQGDGNEQGGPRTPSFQHLGAAERAGLVEVDRRARVLRFRHPLVRATVVDMADPRQLRRAHRALAATMADDPDRQVWHLAAAAVGPDEAVAAQLERTGRRILRRGDATGAVAAWTRAAELSPNGSDRGRRLATAAYVGADVTGDLAGVSGLLADARRADPDQVSSLDLAVAAAYLLLNGEGDVDTAYRLLVAAMSDYDDDTEAGREVLTEAVHTLMLVCFFGGRRDLWSPFHRAVQKLGANAPPILQVLDVSYPDPARVTAPVLARLEGLIDGLHAETDPTLIVRTGIAAFYVDRIGGCREALWRVVRDARAGGAVASGINATMLLGFDDYLTGQWEEAADLLAEGLRLCDAHRYRLLAWPGRYGQALMAAARGQTEQMRSITTQMNSWAAPRGVCTAQTYTRHVRSLAALGGGDFEVAYRQAAEISPPGVLASHEAVALWVAMDLVEAARRTGRHDAAAAHVRALHDADVAAISPRLALLVAGSAAMAATDGSAAELFEQAVACDQADRWPFELARVRLAYGEWLRRAHAPTQARVQLSRALETFETLGARPWATRASHELRATGGRPAGMQAPASELTAQEHEIAQLAAAGLTNKQIAEQLFLSHRTVGAHLYRVFPKLGVTSRAALRDALAALSPGAPTDPSP